MEDDWLLEASHDIKCVNVDKVSDAVEIKITNYCMKTSNLKENPLEIKEKYGMKTLSIWSDRAK